MISCELPFFIINALTRVFLRLSCVWSLLSAERNLEMKSRGRAQARARCFMTKIVKKS